jgi:hypothetical protein
MGLRITHKPDFARSRDGIPHARIVWYHGGSSRTVRDYQIDYHPDDPCARFALAHEFGHLMNAIARGGKAPCFGSTDAGTLACLLEEMTAWAVARRVSKARVQQSYWGRKAMSDCLGSYLAPDWACEPSIPDDVPLTSELLRWLTGEDCGLNRLKYVGIGAVTRTTGE